MSQSAIYIACDRYREDHCVWKTICQHLEYVPFSNTFKVRVRLEHVHLLEQKRSDRQHHDKESPPNVLVFLNDV